MATTPDRAPGPSQEEELQLEDRTADGDPTIEGAIRRVGDDLRLRQSTGVISILDTLWQLVTGNLQPQTNGLGIKLYDGDGVDWVTMIRDGGNFAITVGGTDAQAFYKNCMREVTQLGDVDDSVYAHVSNGGDSPCHTIYGDRTTKSYGKHVYQNADVSSEHLDVGRDATNGYLRVYGGDEILQLTQKILEARLTGTSAAEMFRIISDSGDAFKVFADLTAQFFGLVTHGGNVVPDAAGTRYLGTGALRWDRGYFDSYVELNSGSIDYTRLLNGELRSNNTSLLINGGFGLTLKVGQTFSDCIIKFVAGLSNLDATVRTYHGTGGGSNYTDLFHDGSDGVISTGAGLLKLDPDGDAVVLPASAGDPSGVVDQAVWYDSDDDVFRGRAGSSSFTFAKRWQGSKVYYVGKHGSDSNDGLSNETAFLTFGAAISAVNAQTPSSSNTFCIKCADGGQYTENLTWPVWTYVHAPAIILIGTQTVVDNCALEIGIFYTSSGVAITKSTGTGKTWIKFGQLLLVSGGSGIACYAGSVLIEGGFAEVEDGYALGDSSTTGSVVGSIHHIELTGDGIAIGAAGGSGASLNFRVNHIHQHTGSGIGVYVGAGVVASINVQKLECSNVAYQVLSTGTLKMSVNDISGTETNAGTADVSYAGGKYPPSATDPSDGRELAGDRYFNTAIGKWMTYDDGRSKWLSEDSVVIQFGRNGDVVAGEYYRGVNGLLLSATSGYPALWDGTIVALGYTRSDTDAATFEVVEDGSAIAELASSAAVGTDVTLDGDFSAGGVISLRNKTGGNTTSDVQCWITLRWRA